jgi:hypothetical protein
VSELLSLPAYEEVVSFFAGGPNKEAIAEFHLSSATVERVRALLLKKSAGTLTPDEDEELEQCIQLDRLVMLIRSRARQEVRGNKGA